jgi:transcriptional regulator with XRE-family HTH domain
MLIVGMAWRMELKTAIRRMREEAGMTQTKLAKAIGVEQPSVSRWEKGVRPEPENIAALKKFAAENGLEFDLSGTTWASPWCCHSMMALSKRCRWTSL